MRTPEISDGTLSKAGSPLGQLADLVRDAERLDPTLDVIERAYIKWVLETNGGNKTRAAEVLGIDPSTLHRKLQKMEGSA